MPLILQREEGRIEDRGEKIEDGASLSSILHPLSSCYAVGENEAGMRILVCWLTSHSRVLGGQFGSFADCSRMRWRSAMLA